jgi:hypothetical protein
VSVPSINPADRRRLQQMFMRLRSTGREDARSIVRRELSGVVRSDGSIDDRAIGEASGDVEGALSDLMVVGLMQIPIALDQPNNGEALVFDGVSGQLRWSLAAGAGGYYEPIVADDAETSEAFMWEDGDILLDGPLT